MDTLLPTLLLEIKTLASAIVQPANPACAYLINGIRNQNMDDMLLEYVSRAIEVALPVRTSEDMAKAKELACVAIEAYRRYKDAEHG